MDNFTNFQTYVVAFYFTVTTITTVGYGDISGTNSIEKFIANIIMVLGVILFSLISTSITTILTNYDNINIDE
jgi:voltage-gated potassium channel